MATIQSITLARAEAIEAAVATKITNPAQTADIADGAVTSAKIADGTIVAGDIASNAVTTAKILDANVTTAKIADANVTTAKIADSAITSAKIADGTIATADIADSAITTAKIADGAITNADVNASANIAYTKLQKQPVSNLSDVSLSGLADKQVLTYEASTSLWKNKQATGGVTVGATAPASPNPGDAWFDSNDGTMYVWYADGNSNQWVQVQANSALEGSILARLSSLEGTRIAELASATIKVNSQAERTTAFPNPVQGNSVFRNDLGIIERYYGLYNSSTNLGGRTPAGWYSGSDGGLVPMIPASVVVSGGTATVSGNGLVTVAGTACASLLLENVFPINSGFTKFRVMLRYQGYTTAGQANYMKLANGTTPDATANTFTQGIKQVGTNPPVAYYTAAAIGGFAILSQAGYSTSVFDIYNPNVAMNSTAIWTSQGYEGGNSHYTASGQNSLSTAFNGLQLTSTGAFTGDFQVFGYRN